MRRQPGWPLALCCEIMSFPMQLPLVRRDLGHTTDPCSQMVMIPGGRRFMTLDQNTRYRKEVVQCVNSEKEREKRNPNRLPGEYPGKLRNFLCGPTLQPVEVENLPGYPGTGESGPCAFGCKKSGQVV
eukprot:203838-Rhodomonas_salina.1